MSASDHNDATFISTNKSSKPGLASDLHSALDMAREKFISTLKFPLMKHFYRPIYNKNHEALKDIHEQLCSQLSKTIGDDIDQGCKEQNIDDLLNSLDALKKDQDSSQPSWRPSGNSDEDLRDHLYPLKVQHKESLKALLNKLMVANEELINVVTVNHAEIMHMKKTNEDLDEKLNWFFTSATGSNLQNLQRTISTAVEEV